MSDRGVNKDVGGEADASRLRHMTLNLNLEAWTWDVFEYIDNIFLRAL